MESVDILALLDVAYGGTKEQRTEATSQLEGALKASPARHILTMLQYGCNPQAPQERSLAALLCVKNFMLHDMEALMFRNTQELEQVKAIILSGLATVPPKHRRVLLEMVNIIISEFGWNYFPTIVPSLDDFQPSDASSTLPSPSSSSSRVLFAHALLESVYALTRRFKTIGLEPMDMKVQVSMHLCAVLPKFFSLNDMHTFHVAFKIFECAMETFQQLPSKQAVAELPISVELYNNWLSYLGAFPQTFHAHAVGLGDKEYQEYVKCVKRIGAICFSILHDATKKKKAAAIATHFLEHFSAPFVRMWIQWLTFCLASTDRSTHRKSEIFAIRFIKMATVDEGLYRTEIQPRALEVIEHQLFPFLCFNELDEEVFHDEDSLQEYAQYMMDETLGAGELSQRHAASNAIVAMVSGKKAHHDTQLLHSLLPVLQAGLAGSDDTPAAAARTFGFLHLLIALRKPLKELKDVWEHQMETVLVEYIAPRLHSRYLFVKCKAIYVCEKYCRIPWASEERFAGFTAALSNHIRDEDARVRLSAINTLCTLLEMKRARRYLHHILVPLVNECLFFLEKVQTTFVPLVLNYLAENFAAELTPVLDKLVASLVQQYLAAAFDMAQQESTPAQGASSDAELKSYETLGLSAFQSMNAINNIVISVEYNRGALIGMLPDIMRLLKHIFEHPDCMDFMDKAIEIFQHVVFMTQPVPSCCWELFPTVYNCVMSSGVGVDFFAKFEGVLDNFVSRDPITYFSSTEVMEMTYRMCEKMLVGGVVANDEDVLAAPQLIEALFHQAKHCVNPLLLAPHHAKFVTLLLRALADPAIQQRSVLTRMWLMIAMMDSFYYDANRTLGVMIESGAFPYFFTGGLFEFFSGVLRPMEAGKKKKKKSESAEVVATLNVLFRKVMILGLTSFLMTATDPSNTAVVTQLDPALVTSVLHLISYCMAQNRNAYVPRCANLQQSIENVQSGFEEEVHDDHDEEDLDLGGDDEGDLANDVDDIDEEGNEDDQEDGDNNDGDDTDEYMSPIDSVCEVGYFKQWLAAARSASSPFVTMAASVIPSEEQLSEAELTSQKYISLMNTLDKVREEDHQRRAAAAIAQQQQQPSLPPTH